MKGTRDSNYELVYDFGLIAKVDDQTYYLLKTRGDREEGSKDDIHLHSTTLALVVENN